MQKERNSSIELFRILSTFLVLIVHYNGWFVGGMPSKFDFENPTSFRVGQMIIEAFSVICVNCFLLISGYFGINLTLKMVYKYVTLLLGIFLPMYLAQAILFDGFEITRFLKNCLPISIGGYFVQCYFMLMLLSPVLNSFVDNKGKVAVKWVGMFILIEFYFGCIQSNNSIGFASGYSVIHFCLMYVVARMIALYKDIIIGVKRIVWLLAYMISTIFIIVMYILGVNFAYSYVNPFVILSSIFLFLPFIYKTTYNPTINWIAKSTFAVYILQVTLPAAKLIRFADNHLLNSYNYGIYLIFSVFVIIGFFLICVIYDKVRAFCFDPFFNRTYSWLTTFVNRKYNE